MSLGRAHPLRALAFTLSALAVASLAGAACTDDGTTAAGANPTPPVAGATDTTLPATAAATPDPQSIQVTAVDYRFEGIPDTVPVGSELTLTNTSTDEVHEMVIFRLPDGESRTAGDLAKLPMDQLQATFAGPPTMVIIAPPGSNGFLAVGDGTIGRPGRYVALCAIPTGADPAAYLAAAKQSTGGPVSVPGGPPHYMAGMLDEFTVA